MKRILCFGDSNTFGYDPRSYFGERYPESVRWTGRLEAEDRVILNYGRNGMEIPTGGQAISVCREIVERERPDTVFVMLGSNDLLRNPGVSAEQIAFRMENFLSRLMENLQGVEIFLIAPPPLCPGEWVRDERLVRCSGEIGNCYRRVAERLSVAFADAGAWGIDLAFDGVHFLPSGHHTFADQMERILLEST